MKLENDYTKDIWERGTKMQLLDNPIEMKIYSTENNEQTDSYIHVAQNNDDLLGCRYINVIKMPVGTIASFTRNNTKRELITGTEHIELSHEEGKTLRIHTSPDANKGTIMLSAEDQQCL